MPYPTDTDMQEYTQWLSQESTLQKSHDLLAPDNQFEVHQHNPSPIAGIFKTQSDYHKGVTRHYRNSISKRCVYVVTNYFLGADGQVCMQLDCKGGEYRSGESMDQQVCWVLRFDSGKRIVRWDQYFDTGLVTRNVETAAD